jgi:hypothetical protein
LTAAVTAAAVGEKASPPDDDSLLHPLDHPGARRFWLWGWVLRRSAGPAGVLTLIGLSFIPNVSALAVLVGPLLAWGALAVGGWRLTHAGWGFIPEWRRVPGPRPAPLRWDLWYAGVSGVVAVAVGMTVVAVGLGPDPAGHTAAFVVGALLVVAMAGVVRLGYRAARRHWRELVVGLPYLSAALVVVVMAGLRLPHGGRGLRGDLFSGAEAVTVVYLFLRAVSALARSLWWRRGTAGDPAVSAASDDDPVVPTTPVRKRRRQ